MGIASCFVVFCSSCGFFRVLFAGKRSIFRKHRDRENSSIESNNTWTRERRRTLCESLKLCYRERWSELQYVFGWQGANTVSPSFGEIKTGTCLVLDDVHKLARQRDLFCWYARGASNCTEACPGVKKRSPLSLGTSSF